MQMVGVPPGDEESFDDWKQDLKGTGKIVVEHFNSGWPVLP